MPGLLHGPTAQPELDIHTTMLQCGKKYRLTTSHGPVAIPFPLCAQVHLPSYREIQNSSNVGVDPFYAEKCPNSPFPF